MPTIDDLISKYRGGGQSTAATTPRATQIAQSTSTPASQPGTIDDLIAKFRPETPESTGSTVHESTSTGSTTKANNGMSFQQRMAQAEYERKKQEGILVDDERKTAQNRRQSLIDELGQIENDSGWVTDEQTASTQAARRQAIVDELHGIDEQLGNPAQAYTQSDRVGSVFGGWAQRRGGNDLNALLTIGRAAGEAQARAQLNSTDQFLVDQMLGEDTRARAQQYEDAIHSDEYNAAWDKAYAVGDRWAEAGNQNLAYAKEGVNGAGRLAIGLGVGALDLAGDAVVNAVAPGAGQVAMATRVFGEAAREQRLKGGSQEQQLLAGTKAAAIEVLTEKIGGPFEKLYGKTLTGKMINTALDGIDNKVIRKALDMAADAFGEAAEEMLSDLANPVADYLLGLDDELKSWKDVGQSYDIQEILYDGLVGGILGLAGSATQVMGQGGQITPEQAAQIKEQAAQSAIQAVERKVAEYRAIYENSNGSTAAANAILRDPAALQSYIDQYGELQGKSRSEQAREIAANLRGEDVVQTPVEPVQTPRERMADQGVPTVDRPRGPAGPTQNEANVQQANQMRDTVLDFLTNPDAKPSAAREIVDDPKLRAVYEALTGEKLSDSRNKAKQQVLDRAKSDNPAPNEATADITSVLFGNEADQTGADATAFIQGLQNQNQPAPATAQEQTAPATEQPAQNGQRPVVEANTAEEYAERNFATETPQNRAQTMDADEGIPASTTTTERIVAQPQELNSQPTNTATQQTAQRREPTAPDGMKRSQTESNTLDTVAENLGGEQEPLYYTPITEKQTMTAAMNRANADRVGEMQNLMDKEMWTAEDIDTGLTLYGILKAESLESGDSTAANAWAKVVQEHGTRSGQALQAFSKWTRSAEATAVRASEDLESAAKDGTISQEEADRISNDIFGFAQDLDRVKDGDIDSIRDLILRQNEYRKTGTFVKKNFDKMLNEVQDFDWLREYATRQLMNIADDATVTADLGQKLKTWQVNAQLSRLGTFLRNIGGNVVFGTQDAFTQNGLGVALDWLVSKGTGKRTVGWDKGWFSSKARKGARDAFVRSVLEVAGDVDMTGKGNRYGTTANRTFKMSGNGFDRFMSRWEQLLAYSLTTSDRVSRGQIEASSQEGLENFDLTDEERAALSEELADYRLFQNKGTAYKLSKGTHDVLNILGVGGEVNGVTRTGGFGAGDLLNPYPGVPANLAVKALEYSPLNVIKGGRELVKLFKRVNQNKITTADGKTGGDGSAPTAKMQQQAVMDISRGMAGVPIIALLTALFKAGIAKNADDEDDLDAAAQKRAEGRTGVQLNLDAALRAFNGESAEWRSDDDLMSIGWLEPLNAFMAIASMIAEEDEDATKLSYAKDYFAGAIQSVLDMPVMGNIADAVDTFRYSDADKLGGKAADAAISLAGNAATGMIPAPVGQTARTVDKNYRDTNSNTAAGRVWNNLRNTIPGLRETLPVKRDGFGEEMEYGGNVGQRFLNNFVLPGAINTLRQSDASAEIERLHEATGANVYPYRNAPKSIGKGEDKVDLSPEMRREFHETEGAAYADAIDALMKATGWDALTEDQQTAALSEAKAAARNDAEDAAYESAGSEKRAKRDKWEGLDAGERTLYLVAKAETSSIFDKEGKVTSYEDLDKLLEKNGPYSKLSDKAREVMGTGTGMSRLDDMYDARGLGIKSETYYDAWSKYKDLNEADDKTAAAEELKTYISKMPGLSKSQKTWLTGNLNLYRVMPVETQTYDKFVGAGVKAESAETLAGSFRDITPVGDYKGVQNSQKYQAIASASYLTDAEKWAAFFALMNDNTKKCEEQARDVKAKGYTYDEWAAGSSYAVVKQQKGK